MKKVEMRFFGGNFKQCVNFPKLEKHQKNALPDYFFSYLVFSFSSLLRTDEHMGEHLEFQICSQAKSAELYQTP